MWIQFVAFPESLMSYGKMQSSCQWASLLTTLLYTTGDFSSLIAGGFLSTLFLLIDGTWWWLRKQICFCLGIKSQSSCHSYIISWREFERRCSLSLRLTPCGKTLGSLFCMPILLRHCGDWNLTVALLTDTKQINFSHRIDGLPGRGRVPCSSNFSIYCNSSFSVQTQWRYYQTRRGES